MTILFDPRNYASVPVQLWPLLFLRLWSLYWWTCQHDREVIYEVLPSGRICVHFIADDASDLRAWLWRQGAAPRPHLAPLDNASGSLAVNPIVLLMARAVERMGYFERWIWVRVVMRQTPPIRDSS